MGVSDERVIYISNGVSILVVQALPTYTCSLISFVMGGSNQSLHKCYSKP